MDNAYLHPGRTIDRVDKSPRSGFEHVGLKHNSVQLKIPFNNICTCMYIWHKVVVSEIGKFIQLPWEEYLRLKGDGLVRNDGANVQ